MDEVLIPITFFLMIAAIVIGPTWLKSRERREMQNTLRTAVERGQPLPPELIEALTKDQVRAKPTASRDLRIGVILLAVSVGIGFFGYAVSYAEQEAMYPIAGAAAIPGMIGLAFIVLSFFNKNKD